MRLFCPRFLLLVLLCCPATLYAQEQDKLDELSDSLFSELGADTPGVSLGIYRGLEPVYEAAFGTADLTWGIPVSSDTVFLLASVSKQFTAWAVATLAAEGTLDLDADIRDYVPEMHVFPHAITVRHLLHHTSGLRDEFDLLGMAGYRMDDVITHQTILDLAYRQRALNFEPGSEYLYSNTGYSLLAEIVKRVSGKSLGVWLKENVFEPLQMNATHVHEDYTAWKPRLAQGYEPNGKDGFRRQIYSYENVGSTGVFSTVPDLVLWADALNNKAIGAPGVWSLAHTRGVLASGDTLSYAFGQSVDTFRGHDRVAHSGWHRGFRTVLMRFPEDNMTIVVLANTNEINPSDAAERLMTTIFHPGPDSLAVYAGTYFSDELGTSYTVTMVDGSLEVEHERNSPFELTWTGPDAFETSAWYFDAFRFVRDDAGQLTGLEASTNRARNIVFHRR